MKFVTSLVCAAAAIACLPAAHADVLAKAKESGEITFAYRESSVPFSYLAGGQNAIGFSVDISNAVADVVRKEIAKASGQQLDPKYADIMILIIDSDKDYRLHEQ